MRKSVLKYYFIYFLSISVSIIAQNHSLSFDGQSGHVSVSDSPSLNFGSSSISYSLWFKKPQSSHYLQTNLITDYITATTPSFGLMIEGEVSNQDVGKVRIFYRTTNGDETSIQTSQRYDDNQWHHVVAIKNYENSKILLYVDGNLEAEQNVNMGDTYTGQGFIFAGAHLSRYMDVTLDEVAVLNKALSQEEIEEIYILSSSADLTQLNSTTESLKGYWKMNEGSGSDISDASGEGNSGIIIGGVSWNSDVPPVFPVPGGNNSLSFDGNDDYVDTGIPYTSLSGVSSLTVEFVFKQLSGDDDGQYQGLITSQSSGNTQIAIRLSDQNNIEFGFKDDNSNFSAAYLDSETIIANQWYSVKIKLEDNEVRWYLNYELVEVDNVVFQSLGQESNNVPSLSFGRGNTVYGEYFDGLFDDIKILINNDSVYFAHWDFNEGEGSMLNDLSGNGNNATIYGDAIWSGDFLAPPVYGCTDTYAGNYNPDATADDGSCSGYPNNGDYSLSFDGNGDHVKVESIMNGPVGTIDFTFSSWIKLSRTDVNSAMVILCSNELDQFQFAINTGGGNGGVFDAYIGGSGTSTPSLFWESNVWYHIAAVRQNGNVKYYRDGVFINETNNGSYINSPSFYDIGFRTSNSAHPFYGNINNLAIWETALTEEQIQSHMSGELSVEEEGLAAYWKFNSGEGDILYDHSGNQNHGTINGVTWSEDVYVPPIPPVPGGNNFLSFDGENDYVEMESFELGVSFSFDTEFFLPEGDYNITDAGKTIFSYGPANDGWEAFSFGISSAGQYTSWNEPTLIVEFGRYNNYQYAANMPIDLNASHHVLISYNEGNLIVYQDGIEVINLETLSELQDDGANRGFDIGRRTNDGQYFPGSINYLRIWNEAIGEDELINILNGNEFSNDNFKANWKFDSGEGDILLDHSGNQNHGTIYGATWIGGVPVPLVFGCTDTYAGNYNPNATADDGSCSGYPDNGNYSLDFNGSGDHVNVGTSPSTEIAGDISLAAWVKIDDFDNTHAGVVSKVSDGLPVGYAFEKSGTQNKLSFWTGDGSGFCELRSSVLSTDTWYFVAATNDGSTSRIYINGELSNTSNCGAPAGPTADLRIGIHSNLSDSERYWDGSIDDVSIWNVVLTDADILNLYETSVNGNEEGLAAYWKFNSGDGDVLYDHSGNANHGTINGASWNLLPVEGGNNSLSFDGVNDYVETNDIDLSSSSGLTISMWFNSDGFGGNQTLVRNGGNWDWILDFTDTNIRWMVRVGGETWNELSLPNTLSNDTWTHIAAVYEYNTQSIYINGELLGSQPNSYPVDFVDQFSENTFIGSCCGPNETFSGYIDELSLWTRSLTQSEIQANMSTTLIGNEGDLAAYWNFNEGEGPTLTDLSGNSNDGTINGASWSGDAAPVGPPVYGCTDPYANNYNPEAVADDGSCTDYPQDGNRSLNFDGVDDFADFGNSEDFAITQSISATIMMWVKPRSNGYLLSKYENSNPGNSNFFLGVEPNGQLRLSGDGTDAWDFGQAMMDQWQHITLVFNPGQPVQAYIDGSFVGSQNINLSSNISDRPLLMGQSLNPSNSDGYLDANIDQLLIWGSALTEDEIQPIIFTDSIGYYSNLLAHWKFNANGGDILFDHSGNANHGSINGATWDEGFVAPPTAVTFLVNLRDYVESSGDSLYNGVYIAGGNIGADNPEDSLFMGHEMSDGNGDFIYEVTLDLEKNTHYLYKYRIGPATEDWNGNWEGGLEECGEGEWFDRNFDTDFSSNMIVGPYCFNSCENCEVTNMSLNFDGTDDYVTIPTSESIDQITTGLTLSAWINPHSYGDGAHTRIFNRTEGTGGGVDRWLFTWSPSSDNYTVNFGGGASFSEVKGNTAIQLNRWTNVVATFENSLVKIYVDGNLDSEGNVNFNELSFVQNVDITIGSANSNSYFPGKIDNTSIWNRVLSEQEIQENMYNNLSGYEDGLVGYWNFNDGDGDVLTDLSPNGNNGNINGATWSNDSPQPPHTGPEWYVSESGSDSNNGSSEYPVATIQFAINAANDGDSIFVGPGTYGENIDLSGRSLGLRSLDGPESTVIDGGQNGRVVSFDNPNSLDAFSIIDGFTIRNGQWDASGAGINIYYGNLDLVNLIIENNESTADDGGGFSIEYGHTNIYNCLIRNNNANRGGGLAIRVDSDVHVVESEIESNFASGKGGGIYISNASAQLQSLVVKNNLCNGDQGGSGGGIMVEYSDSIFINNVALLNNSGIQGGGIFIDHNSNVELFNGTIAGNYADSGGGLTMYNSTLSLLNSIVWGNPSANNQQMNLNGSTSMAYSNIQGLPGAFSGDGNIDLDPLFCNAGIGEFTIAENSPCLGAGDSGVNMGALDVGCAEPYSNFSLSFDGGSNVNIGNPESFALDDFTISFWFNSTYSAAAGDWRYILGKQNSYHFELYGNGVLRFGFEQPTGASDNYGLIDSDGGLNDGSWHHVTATRNATTGYFNLYIDGEIVNNNYLFDGDDDFSDLTGTLENSYNFYIGVIYEGHHGPFTGKVDELSIWDRALTEEEIQNYHGNALSGLEQGLVAHYGFNDGDGTTLTDLSGNGNNGSINGATWADGAPLAAPVPPDPEIYAVNVDISGNDVSFSVDAAGYFSHYQWRFDWDGPVMSYESTSLGDLGPGLHYVRVALMDENNEMVTDEVLQSFYILDGLTQHLYTGFEEIDESGYPSGWSAFSNGQGWYVSDDPYFEWWTTEPGVGNVVISNDDAANNDGENDFNDGSADYLNMPELDFTSFGGPVALEFGSYFDGQWGQTAHIYYSSDGGNTFNPLTDIWGGEQWERQYVDLTNLQNYESVILGFYSNDNGGWGAGWIVDDVSIIDAYEHTTFPNINSIVFDGQDDYIDIPGNQNFSVDVNDNQLTIVAWVNIPDEVQGSRMLIEGWPGYGYHVYITDGKIDAVFGEYNVSDIRTYGSTDLRGTGWRHVAVTLNNGNVRVYVDGQLDGSESYDNSPVGSGTDNLTIGKSPWSENENFVGLIDEVAIWNTHRSRQDIERIMYENVGVYSDDALIAYWNFNSGSGDLAIDKSGNGHDGTIFGGQEWSDDIPPYMEAPEDDGNYSVHMYDYCFIDVPVQGLTGGSDPATLEAWFYREYYASSTEYILSYGAQNGDGSMFGLGLQNNNIFATFLGTNYDVVSSTSYPLEQWNHVAAVHHGGGAVELYLNGQSVYSTTVDVPNVDAGNLKIGSYPMSGQNWNGYIDEVRVWDTARSQEEIQNSMHNSLRGTESGLVGNWAFDENDGNIAHDKSSYVNHGTIYNGYGWSDLSSPLDGTPAPVVLNVPVDYASIQEAIDVTFPGDTVLVQPGTYYENISLSENPIVLISLAPITQDMSYIDQTIIDAGGSGRAVQIEERASGGEINGFTLQNGYVEMDSENWPENEATGLFLWNAHDFRAINLVVRDNQGRWGGGISVNWSSNTYFENIRVENNTSEAAAGIFYNGAGHGYAKDIVIIGNTASNNGGGVYFYNGSNIDVVNLRSEGNSSVNGGGVLSYRRSHPTITNAVIINNSADNSGGGVNIFRQSSLTLTNATVYGNNAPNDAGPGVFLGADSPLYLVNSIVWGNSIRDVNESPSVFIESSIIENGYEGDNVFDVDPLFVDQSNNDFHVLDGSLSIGNGLDLTTKLSNTVTFRMRDTGGNGFPVNGFIQNESGENVLEIPGEDWGSETTFGPFELPNGSYMVSFDWENDSEADETTWNLIADNGWIVRHGGVRNSTNFTIGEGSIVGVDVEGNLRPNPEGSNPDMGAYESPLGVPVLTPDIVLSGTVFSSEDGSALPGASVIIVQENNVYNVQSITDNSGYYSADIISGLNYYVNVSLFNYQEQSQYIFVNDTSNYLDIYLDVDQTVQDALVEGTVFDWYSESPITGGTILFAYSDDSGDIETIEISTDGNGYFMAQVPGEQDYDIFIYADGYWVEHDAFFLGSGEAQVLSVGIAPMVSASRLYGTVRDFETGDLIPYAEVQLNCDMASDWDHTGELGTYRVFNYYPGDCDNGALVVSASGYETSIQSVSGIEFELGSSVDLDINLAVGNDPEPGILSGEVYSNIDGSLILDANISAYSITTGQVFDAQSDSGSFSIELPESEYTVAVNADGHQELFASVSIESGSMLDTMFYLDEVYSNTFFGVVYDSDGSSLEGVTVTANMVGEYDYTELSTVTADDGSYQLIVPDGYFNLSASLTGFQIAWVNDVSIENGDQEIDFTLEVIESFDGAVMGVVYFFGNLSGTATVNVWNDVYSAETVTADNGSYYLDLVNGTYSIFVASNGYTSIFMADTITINNNVIIHDIHFTQPGFVEPPFITSLTDVPEDQGRKLNIEWSPGDPEDYGTYTQYSVWRRIDNLPPGTPELYHYILTVGFDEGASSYDRVVPTLVDANIDTAHSSTFMVTAHTEDPYVFFDSPPVTGFSIDNLFPAVPADIVISSTEIGESTYSVDISWSNPEDEDFAYHNVYRADIGSDDAAFVFQTIESSYNDIVSEWGNYEYSVTAVDHNGNESDPSSVAGIELAVEEELLPEEFALGQNYPNPFNPSTQIRYALPEQSRVTITIYNMLGGKVRTLVNDYQDAGYRNILWNATNDNGAPVSAGMYIYTIQAGNFYQAKKMILLK